MPVRSDPGTFMNREAGTHINYNRAFPFPWGRGQGIGSLWYHIMMSGISNDGASQIITYETANSCSSGGGASISK